MQSHGSATAMRGLPNRGRSRVVGRLVMICGLGALGAAGVAISIYASPGRSVPGKAPALTSESGKDLAWVAAAPGRVEPKSGPIRLAAAVPGRVVEVIARMNDQVTEGEVLIRLDDKEARARLGAAEAEAAARKRERDAQPGTAGREDVKKGEDAVFAAERAVTNARFELDDVLANDRRSPGSPQTLLQARKRLAEAKDRLRQEQIAFAGAYARTAVPAPNRLEAALIAARAEVTLAEELLDRARVRAPMSGTVLQVNAKRGEMVDPSAEVPLIVMGDMSVKRVRAEVDENDVAKIKLGQKAFVRSTGFPGRDFEGRVTELAASLALPRLGSRGPRRPTDVEVMEVMIELDGSTPLLPGMRAEAYFRQAN